MVHVVSGNSFFEQMLGDISYEKDSPAGKMFPFLLRVGVIKRRPPRHNFFEFLIDMGYPNIDKVLKKEMIEDEVLNFVFPERWMNQPERRIFMHYMTKNPGIKNIKQVDIITTDPLLVGSFRREQIRVITWPEDSGKYD